MALSTYPPARNIWGEQTVRAEPQNTDPSSEREATFVSTSCRKETPVETSFPYIPRSGPRIWGNACDGYVPSYKFKYTDEAERKQERACQVCLWSQKWGLLFPEDRSWKSLGESCLSAHISPLAYFVYLETTEAFSLDRTVFLHLLLLLSQASGFSQAPRDTLPGLALGPRNPCRMSYPCLGHCKHLLESGLCPGWWPVK